MHKNFGLILGLENFRADALHRPKFSNLAVPLFSGGVSPEGGPDPRGPRPTVGPWDGR